MTREHVDLLRWPGVGRFLRWRWSRGVLQGFLLLIALLMLYDGFTGPPEPYRNLSTVLAWIWYRGVLLLALLAVGNLFCMACPFALPRTLARRLSLAGPRWPRALRTKGLAVAGLFLIFFLYEWLDLWASPWLTAWVIVGYFVAAFVLEALFHDSPFCKYICPLGQFNYVHSALSPFQIQARDPEVCRTCPGKECLRGSNTVPGCGTLLFVPQMRSNLDCVLCLDCARACPYDNVALQWRGMGREVTNPSSWPVTPTTGFLPFFLVAAALANAFGMVPPAYTLLDTLTRWGVPGEGVRILLLLAVLTLVLPWLAMRFLGWWHARHLEVARPWHRTVARLSPALIPLSFGIWAAHYGFHFLSTAWVLFPVVQEFARAHGWDLGPPSWQPRPLLPPTWWYPIQVATVLLGFGMTLWALRARARRAFPGQPTEALLFPWVLLAMGVAWAAIAIFALPMEMRGAPVGH